MGKFLRERKGRIGGQKNMRKKRRAAKKLLSMPMKERYSW